MSKYSNDFEVRKETLELLGGNSSKCSNIYEVELEILKIYLIGGGSSGGGKTKVKEITVNNNCIVDGKWDANLIDVSEVTSMYSKFNSCVSLQELDLSSWNVSNVTNMSSMFYNCKKLQTVGDLSNWDVSNVTNMRSMFDNCNVLQELDLSSWNVSNVTDMFNMFYNCKKLQTVGDLSNWDVSNVTDMCNMFNTCNVLQTVGDLSNWDVSKVTNMTGMFRSCSNMDILNLSGWNTSSLTNIGSMFYGAYFEALDITGWTDVSKVNNTTNFTRYQSGQKNGIKSFVGGRTIDEVINNNITILNGLKINISISNSDTDRASIRALINGVANMSNDTAKVITLGSTLKAKITEEDIAIATAKNWTIA